MPYARRTRNPATPRARQESYRIGPRRTLHAGQDADVLFPPKTQRKRATFLFAIGDELTFRHPKNGGLRIVKPENVGTIHAQLRKTG